MLTSKNVYFYQILTTSPVDMHFSTILILHSRVNYTQMVGTPATCFIVLSQVMMMVTMLTFSYCS